MHLKDWLRIEKCLFLSLKTSRLTLNFLFSILILSYQHIASGQSNLAKSASNLSGNRDSHLLYMFLWSSSVSTPSKTSIRLAVFAQRSRVTDRLTDVVVIDRNSSHLMHSTRPK